MKDLWQKFLQRVKQKFFELVPILIGAFLFSVFIAAAFYFFKPYLPDHILAFIDQLENDDWQSKKDTFKAFFEGFGSEKYLGFIGIQVLQVLLAPIPGQVMGLLGGFLFGFWQGLILTMLGLSIGSFLAMLVGRFAGTTIVRRFIPTAIVVEFDTLINRGGVFNFFMIFLLPAFPDDAICFVAGLTQIKLSRLLLASFFGRLPGMAVLAFVGSQAEQAGQQANILFLASMIIAFVVWFFDKELKDFFKKRVSQKKP